MMKANVKATPGAEESRLDWDLEICLTSEDFQDMRQVMSMQPLDGHIIIMEGFKRHIESDSCGRCMNAWLDALALLGRKACDTGYDASADALHLWERKKRV